MRWLSGMLLLGLCACPTGNRGDTCKAHVDCDVDLVCASGKCATAYARNWRLSVQSAHVSTLDPSGDTWDGDGSAPDPFVVVEVENSEVLRTQEVSNSYTPVWGESVVINVNNSTRVLIALWDQDFLLPQAVVATRNEPIPVSELRQGQVTAFAVTAPADAGSGAVTSVTYRWDLVE